jgi:hypothetical protein
METGRCHSFEHYTPGLRAKGITHHPVSP